MSKKAPPSPPGGPKDLKEQKAALEAIFAKRGIGSKPPQPSAAGSATTVQPSSSRTPGPAPTQPQSSPDTSRVVHQPPQSPLQAPLATAAAAALTQRAKLKKAPTTAHSSTTAPTSAAPPTTAKNFIQEQRDKLRSVASTQSPGTRTSTATPVEVPRVPTTMPTEVPKEVPRATISTMGTSQPLPLAKSLPAKPPPKPVMPLQTPRPASKPADIATAIKAFKALPTSTTQIRLNKYFNFTTLLKSGKKPETFENTPSKRAFFKLDSNAHAAIETLAKLDSSIHTNVVDIVNKRRAGINTHINRQIDHFLNVLASVSPDLSTQAEVILKDERYTTHTQILRQLADFARDNKEKIKTKIENPIDYEAAFKHLIKQLDTNVGANISNQYWNPEQTKTARKIMLDLFGTKKQKGDGVGGILNPHIKEIIEFHPNIGKKLKILRDNLKLKKKASPGQLQAIVQNLREDLDSIIANPKQAREHREKCEKLLSLIDNATSILYPELAFQRQTRVKVDATPVNLEKGDALNKEKSAFLIDLSKYSEAEKKALLNSVSKLLQSPSSKNFSIRHLSARDQERLEISGSDAKESLKAIKAIRNIVGNVPITLVTPYATSPTREHPDAKLYLSAKESGLNVNFVVQPLGVDMTANFKALEPKKPGMLANLYQKYVAKKPASSAATPSVEPPEVPQVGAEEEPSSRSKPRKPE